MLKVRRIFVLLAPSLTWKRAYFVECHPLQFIVNFKIKIPKRILQISSTRIIIAHTQMY